MKRFFIVMAVLLVGLGARAKERTWTLQSGETYSAEYVKMLFDDVILQDGQGQELRIPLAEMSEEDRMYIQMCNPPELKVEFKEGSTQKHIRMSPYVPASWQKYPPTVLDYSFGASVRKLDSKTYRHSMTVEVYAFTKQRYDPSKYHMIAKVVSDPFVLDDLPNRRIEFIDPRTFRVIKYEVNADYIGWQESRGEKMAEMLAVVKDERGEVIAYNTTKNWLIDNLDKLEKLPVGAWLDDTCKRVHPTPPKALKIGEPIN